MVYRMKRWPLHKAYFWESAPFFRLLLPLVAGIALYPLWKGSFVVTLFTAVFAYLVFLGSALFKTQNSIKRLTTFLSLNAFFIFLAFTLCFLNDVQNNKQWFGNTINTADFYKVRIVETPTEKESTYKLQVDVLESILPNKTQTAEGKAFLYIYKSKKTPTFHKGDTLVVSNKWQPIKNAGNPFEFDYAAYCKRNNIHYQQFIGPKDIREHRLGNLRDRSYTEAAHEGCMQTLENYVSDKQTLGLIQSMLIGDEVNLDNDTRQVFTETGIVHVIAISGGNIAILFILVMALFSWLRHKKYLWLKYALAMPLVWFYVLMAGASPSAVRAAVMFTLLAIGFVLQKRKDNNSLNQLFATAFILLVAEPMWLYAIGFQLSFIAVLSLILFYKRIYRIYTPTNKILKALWSTAAASIAAEILVAPIVIYYFHTFPLMFIVSNIVAYVLMSCVLILGMAIIAFSFIPVVASAISFIVSLFVGVFLGAIHYLQRYEPLSFHTLRINGPELILLYVLIACIALYFIYRKRLMLVSGIATIILLFISLSIGWARDKEQRRLVVYNVGKLNYVELIEGNTYTVVSSIGEGKIDYIRNPAHIGWQISQMKNSDYAIGQLEVGGKTVRILPDTTYFRRDPMTADYAIIAYRAKLKDLRMIDSLLHPGTIIISYSMPGRQLNDWKAICSEKGIRLHSMQDGAFILEDE
jgi:competence protein ComEC